MSALDQAIIKAYAKDRPAAATAVAPPSASTKRPAPAAGSGPVRALERLYHDGSLYRVEQATIAAESRQAVPTPHLPNLPPTSPRRSIRRSLLRLQAANSAAPPIPLPAEPPKVARKVIIRHISHSVAPPPLGLLRSPIAPRVEDHQPTIADLPDFTADLPPETIADEPEPTPHIPVVPLVPVAPSLPQPALPAVPFNFSLESIPQFQIRGEWRAEECIAPLVMLAEGPSSEHDLRGAIVTVQLDGLAAAEAEAYTARKHLPIQNDIDQPAPTFLGKSLDDREEPRVEFRLDAPHAFGRHRPHARFKPAEEPAEPTVAEQVAPQVVVAQEVANREVVTQEEELILAAPVAPAIAPEISFAEAVEANELTIAAAIEEPLASDLIPVEPLAQPELTVAEPDAPELAAVEAIASETAVVATVEAAKPAAPLWEVDQFHWPRTCEKLFADEQGYLSRAGEKLHAAMQDGLRVLAITGSRRGEGRSTVALCLARAAANAGIQTAVMDADFARPQLASKVALEVAYGWQDAALGHIPLSEAAIKSLADNVTLLPLESSAAARALSLADPRVTATIRAAAATFELLILDLGPMTASEQLTFPAGEACPFDAAIVVRDLRFSTAAESETVGHALQDAGVEAVGIAENFVIEEEVPTTSV